MPESTLSLQQNQLLAKTADFLGYGRGILYGDPAWTNRQTLDINDAIESAQRNVYYPVLEQGPCYVWSFLRPVATLELIEGEQSIPLPDDFNGIIGTVTIGSPATASTINWWPIKTYNVGMVNAAYGSNPTQTGRPIYLAESPLKGTGPATGQRFQLNVFPLPDQNYQIKFQHQILPDAISAANPFPYGGAAHAELFLESCLAVAELRRDDQLGPRNQAFQARLLASIRQDMQRKPQAGGYNRDRSDYNNADDYWSLQQLGQVSWNGQVPG